MIRPAEPARDAAACAAIYAPSVTDGWASFEDAAPSAEEIAARIPSAHAWLVDERDGVIAGYAYAGEYRSRAAYRWATETAVYTDPVFRRRRVATSLYEALFAQLRAQGFRWAMAGITLPNDASVALHRRFGFALVGRDREVGYKAGAWRHVARFQLDLGPLPDPPPDPRRL